MPRGQGLRQFGLILCSLIIPLFFSMKVQASSENFLTCSHCHGTNGEGNVHLRAPKIAGLAAWYVERQLTHFKGKIRGLHPADGHGALMYAYAKNLSAEEIQTLASYVENLDTPAPQPTIAGDLVAGQQKFATCAACHGANGEGNQALNAPALAGQSDWYVVAQLQKFQRGARGTTEGDIYGAQMRPMSLALSPQDMKNLAVYINSFSSLPQISEDLVDIIDVRSIEMTESYSTTTPATEASSTTAMTSVSTTPHPQYGVCAGCHGQNGGGNQALNAPRIAGQNAWYVARQLKNYKAGIRGTHEGDLYGSQMMPMAATIADDQIESLSAYIETLQAPVQASTLGSAEQGQTKYATCAACHGMNGEGNEALNAPTLAGQADWYIARQLGYFKSGVRGTHPEDMYGAQMRPMSLSLSEEDMKDLGAYVNSMPPRVVAPPAVMEQTSVEAETTTATTTTAMVTMQEDPMEASMAMSSVEPKDTYFRLCASCHGENLEGKPSLNAPRIAGLPAWYIVRQVYNYSEGIRGLHASDIYGAQMRPMSRALTKAKRTGDNSEEVWSIAKYVEAYSAPVLPATLEGDLEMGKQKYATCIACHGENGEGNQALNAPKIAGQADWYIVRQLNYFKNGVRGGDSRDRYGNQMVGIATGLSAEEMKNVAFYINTLSGDANPQDSTQFKEEEEEVMVAQMTLDLEKGATIAPDDTYFRLCASCHGENLEGKPSLNAPRIAGLPAWYIVRQVYNYSDGIRGLHASDIYGAQMRPMSRALTKAKRTGDNSEEVWGIANYVQSYEAPLLPASITGDVVAGKAKYATCTACHGVNGEGNQALNAPKLAGQSDWYLKRQLTYFKNGVRGADPRDTIGSQMIAMAAGLSNTDMTNIVAYINTFSPVQSDLLASEEIAMTTEPTGMEVISGVTKMTSSHQDYPQYAYCAGCHGEKGEGNQYLNAPRLAGLPSWYLSRQLLHYQSGIRGSHPNDIYGPIMKAMSKGLQGEEEINAMASYLQSLEAPVEPGILGGNPEQGKQKYATCIACHGANGEGNQMLNAPSLAGQADWYIVRQLAYFKEGTRGTAEGDMYGSQMMAMAMPLSEEDMKDIGAYVNSLPAVAPMEAVSTVAMASDSVDSSESVGASASYSTCIACHGANGEGNAMLNAPRIGGLPAWYIARQLNNYKTGVRGNHEGDTYGSQMRPMAMALDDATIESVANYVENLEATVQASTLNGDIEKGKASYVTCIACHGANGEGNPMLNAPKLAGQADWYLARQLAYFKSGVRGTHEGDVYGAQMRPMSLNLSEEDMNNLASYLHSLE